VTNIFDNCTPRSEVRSGELRDEQFAARLKDVVDEHAEPVYGVPERFFDNTYVTEGLRTLVREVFGRLSGTQATSSPFIRLETSFGGGKTHNLIALYHLATGAQPPSGLLDPSWLPADRVRVAALVGSEMGPAEGIRHGPVTTRTLWGEVAYQLGHEDGYRLVEEGDTELVAPGTQWLDDLVGDEPTLIMIDELARYLVAAKAKATPNRKSDLAEQTVAFLLSLIEFAASKSRVAVVITLAESDDAFGAETDRLSQELSDARRVSARQERVVTPSAEPELAKIVTHRLFPSIDPAAAEATGSAYVEALTRLTGQGVELPQRAARAEYAAEIALAYPFHPELLTTLNRKTATIPNFQKTRGALRLLAMAVRRLWETRPADARLIHIHHLDLGVEDLVNELTSRLERPAFRSVVEADIVSRLAGSRAHCQVLDARFLDAGKPPYAQRVATTVFLHSLTQGTASGVDPADLMLAVLAPEDDPQLVRKALGLMLGEEKGDPGTACWFLHFDGRSYRFKTEPSLEKVVHDEMGMVGRIKAKDELDRRTRAVWSRGVFDPEHFPAEAADVDDDAKDPKLAVIHYDAATASAGDGPPDLVVKLFEHAGSAEGYRTYKNNLIFLVADTDQVERMVDMAQRYLAISRILRDPDRLNEFSDEQRKRLKTMGEAAELDVRVAITRAYRHLYYPSGDARRTASLAHEMLPPQDQGEIGKDQTAVLLRALRQLDKLRTADDRQMPAAYVRSKAWPIGADAITTEDLRREFAKRVGLPMLLDPNQLKRTIKDGVANRTWVYYDSDEQLGYSAESPAPMVRLSDDVVLYTVEEAARLGLAVKGQAQPVETCPLCGQYPCVCDEPEPGPEPGQERVRVRERAEGAPRQAFERIADRFKDAGAAHLSKLIVRCEGRDRQAADDARALGLAIPQLGKGSFQVEQRFNAEFGEGPGAATFVSSFSGGWDRYKRVKQLTDGFGQEASRLSVEMIVTATFADGVEVDGDQFRSMRDLFEALELGRIIVEAEEAERAEEVT